MPSLVASPQPCADRPSCSAYARSFVLVNDRREKDSRRESWLALHRRPGRVLKAPATRALTLTCWPSPGGCLWPPCV